MIMATGGQWAAMFLCLGIALMIDGADGPLARTLRVEKLAPRWSGATIDLVVDFVTYVFIPAYAIAGSGFLPPLLAIPAGAVIVITGALYFSDRKMKTRDNYFRGFPAVWNLVAFYIFVLQPPPWLAVATVAIFAMLTFMPVKFVHPLRVKRLLPVNIGLMVLWGLLALTAVLLDLEPGPWISIGLGLIGVYFLGAGLMAKRAWV
jgi:phosphatidylcholine synthase